MCTFPPESKSTGDAELSGSSHPATATTTANVYFYDRHGSRLNDKRIRLMRDVPNVAQRGGINGLRYVG